MPNPTIQSLLNKTGYPDLLEKLNHELSGSELNSLLLEIFRTSAAKISPQELMKAYENNRFVVPSVLDALTFAKADLQLLELAKQHGFEGLELSPLAPIGSCSSVALVDQNKVVSAVRGTEVVADATNLMALESSVRRKKSRFDEHVIHCCTIHRHVRGQSIPDVKGFTPHFKVFCALSTGKDTGNLDFEKQAMLHHLLFYRDYFVKQLQLSGVKIILKGLKNDNGPSQFSAKLFDAIGDQLSGVGLSLVEVPKADHSYYQHTRFSLNLVYHDKEYNLGDGGFVDWGQKLTGNYKERMFISGIGIELLLKLQHGMI
jgi:hypothetical protein